MKYAPATWLILDRNSLHPILRLTSARAGVAVSSALLATLLTPLMMPFLAQNIFLLFLVAVLASSLHGGMWSGLLASAISTIGVWLGVLEPLGSLAIAQPADVARLVAFAVFGVVVAVLAQALHAARHRAERRTREAAAGEESFRALFDSTADAIYVTSPTGLLLNVNRAAGELHGYARDELLGMTWDSLIDTRLTDVAALREYVEAAFEGKPQLYETWVRHSSGSSIPLEVKLTAARYFERDVVIAVARDVSERRRLEEQLRQSQKMDAIGRLAGGVAHDFNNLLTTIRGYATLMRDGVAHDPSLLEDLREIERAVELATSVTSQLLAFSRKQDYEPRRISLNHSLERMESLLRRLLDERVELVVIRDPELGIALLDEGQIEQVVMNLVVNARDSVRARGRITIRTRNVEAISPPGPHVVLSVEDDGIGMDEGVRARIFEPFYTTKEAGHGTGLGLATVYGIVNQNGGHIEVESVPGAGSTFAVMFPRVDPPAQNPPLAATSAPITSSGALTSRLEAPPMNAEPAPTSGSSGTTQRHTVLLAEDEEPVRQLVSRVLTRRGYNVIEAGNGHEAIDAARAHDGRIDALVTDVVMPRMTGPELAEQLRADQPDLPVLFTSGYNNEGMEGTGIVSGLGIAFLQKPFVPEELLRLLGELLETADRPA